MSSDRQSIDRSQGLSSEQQVARRRHVRLVGQVEVAHDFASIPQGLRQVGSQPGVLLALPEVCRAIEIWVPFAWNHQPQQTQRFLRTSRRHTPGDRLHAVQRGCTEGRGVRQKPWTG